MIAEIPAFEDSVAARYFEARGEKRGEKRGERRGEIRGERRGLKKGRVLAEVQGLEDQIQLLQMLLDRGRLPGPEYDELIKPLQAKLHVSRKKLNDQN